MEIPYTVRPRPDTGLANPKLGIWLFLASEVMLFGGLFAGYIFMRLGAEPWMWPNGWLNVPVGTFNTFVLIFSSVTIILSWESLKMKMYGKYKFWLMMTWVCGLAFLVVKLAVEWPEKFHHFGAYVQKESLHKYEPLLGNEDTKDKQGRISRNKPDRRFISGHLHDEEKAGEEKQSALFLASIPYIAPNKLDDMIGSVRTWQEKLPELEAAAQRTVTATLTEKQIAASKAELEYGRRVLKSMMTLLGKYGMTEKDKTELLDKQKPAEEQAKLRAAFLDRVNHIHVTELDAPNATPYNPDNDSAHFVPRGRTAAKDLEDKTLVHGEGEHAHIVLDKQDLITGHGAFLPRLNTYLACYFMITGLHGLHVLGGCIVFIYFWLNIKGGSKLYHTNHAQLCNRIEVAGLFWHLVDLVWIFVFPIFYLL